MASRKPADVKRSAEYVNVACRIPQGLRVIVPGGDGRTAVDQFLHGAASAHAIAGHGMTTVKTETWNAIVDFYKDHPGARWLHNESVFVSSDAASAQDKAEDRKTLDVGYNPIDPNNPNERARTGVTIQVEGEKDPGEGA